MQKYARIIIYLLVLIATVIFLAAAIPKLVFPYEVQWLEGAMMIEISWLKSGHLLYCPPTIYHVPSVYQPIYFFCNALCTSVTGLSFITARYLSIISTIGLLILIFVVVRKETGKTFYGIAAIGLYFASYAKTEFCFFAIRIDPLLTLLIVLATTLVYYARSTHLLIISSIVFAIAFFTKQSALVFIPSIVMYLWIIRGWKSALIFSAAFIAALVSGILAMTIYSNGWYTFYTFDILRSMTGYARWGYAVSGLVEYIILRCWLIALLMLIFPIRSFIFLKDRKKENVTLFFGIFFAIAIFAGFLGILNSGGGHNVLLQAAAGCAIFLPLVAAELQSNIKYGNIVVWSIAVQLAFLISNPWNDNRNIARRIDEIHYQDFYKYISSLRGEIWIPFHSYTSEFTGKNEYAGFDCFQGALLPNDLRARSLQHQLDTALFNKHWTYILSDIKYDYRYYTLSDSMLNLNKVHFSDDSLLYVYTPK